MMPISGGCFDASSGGCYGGSGRKLRDIEYAEKMAASELEPHRRRHLALVGTTYNLMSLA